MGAALRLLGHELEHAERIVKDHASAIGHRDLAHRLDEMQRTWDDRRSDLVADIKAFGDLASKAGEAFRQVDADLARTRREG